MLRSSLALALTCCFLAPLRAQAVWVVDDAPGPGVHFTDLQSAVDAAGEADTLLVQEGHYDSFTVLGKALNVSAELGALVRVRSGFAVRGLSAQQRVVVRGLETVLGPHWEAGASLKNNAGAVWLEDCVLRGGVLNGIQSNRAAPGLEVVGCAAVTVARCQTWGGLGWHVEGGAFDAGSGGHGLYVDGAWLSVHGGELHGSDGGDVNAGEPLSGGAGGAGAWVENGQVLLSGVALHGGDGGWGDCDLWACGSDGVGGNGLRLPFGGDPLVRLQDCALVPGKGPYSSSPVAQDIWASAGVHVALPGSARAFAASSPQREGEFSALSAQGEAGDAVLLAISNQQGSLALDPFAGDFVLEPLAFQLLPLGGVGASGELAFSLALPSASDPLLAVRSLALQTVHVDAVGAVWLGHGSAITILDAAL